ncbi:DUF3817 domain-containing protein [Actinoplanes solisilvae]|uniref:DUF3817 domain-containing protein n=1 Tax=Actinoplanes solisilvae TaxID=2486853 RepID=UPI000FDC7E59|nr:DUF3817 domain-containing protein [Actinoplanes solisilvae]
MSQPYRIFRITAVAEAFSWAGLLVGMYLKRVAEVTDLGVSIFGPIHGALFVTYVVSVLWLGFKERWSVLRVLVGLSAAIPPFTTLIFERWVAGRRPAGNEKVLEPAA